MPFFCFRAFSSDLLPCWERAKEKEKKKKEGLETISSSARMLKGRRGKGAGRGQDGAVSSHFNHDGYRMGVRQKK